MKYSSVIGWHECSIEYATLIANQGYLTNSLTILSKLPSPTLHPEFSSSWLQRSRAIVLFDDLCRLVWKPPKFSHKFIGDWGTTCIDTTQPSLEHDATRIKSPRPRCLSPQYVRKTWTLNILRFFEILRNSSPFFSSTLPRSSTVVSTRQGGKVESKLAWHKEGHREKMSAKPCYG